MYEGTALKAYFDLWCAVCRAAVFLETGEYDKCIADCDTAVEKGRETRADYKVIARALTRKANALAKQERYEEAVEVYHKSLTEHRYGGKCSWSQ